MDFLNLSLKLPVQFSAAAETRQAGRPKDLKERVSIQNIVYGLIIAVAMAIVMALANKQVRKYRMVLYFVFAVVEAYFVLSQYFDYELFTSDRKVTMMFGAGILSTALFIVVAFMGVLPPKHKVTRRLKSVRAELSVIGCIIGLGQMFYYAPSFTQFFAGTQTVSQEIATISTIVLLILIFPLMLTSFYCVRTNMDPKTWKKIQRWSYLFYFMLWLHVFGLYGTFDGGLGEVFSGRHAEAMIIYTVVFAIYFVLRFCRYLWDRSHRDSGDGSGGNDEAKGEAC